MEFRLRFVPSSLAGTFIEQFLRQPRSGKKTIAGPNGVERLVLERAWRDCHRVGQVGHGLAKFIDVGRRERFYFSQ